MMGQMEEEVEEKEAAKTHLCPLPDIDLFSCDRPQSPPPKRLKSEEEQNGEVSNQLQGEIARLDHRFKVNLDPLYHNGSKTVHLICKLGKNNVINPRGITVNCVL